MNTSQLSQRESAADTQLQVHSRRDPLEAAGAQQDVSRPARPEVVAMVPRSPSPVVMLSAGGGPLNSITSRTFHPGPECLGMPKKPFDDPGREQAGDTAPKIAAAIPAPPSTTTDVPEPVGRVLLNSTASRVLHPGPERFDTCLESGEGAARAAFDSRAGRTLTDADWAVAKDRLLDFLTILRGWDRKARTVSRDLVMFEVPCLREL